VVPIAITAIAKRRSRGGSPSSGSGAFTRGYEKACSA
jgi:hypothetical protein